MGAAAQAGPATLVFDEVMPDRRQDRAARRAAARAAAGRQVICINAYAQIASLPTATYDRQ